MKDLKNTLTPFCHITKVPVTYYESNGNFQWASFSEEKICNAFLTDEKHMDICRESLLSSIAIAANLGEPYIFLCPSGLIKIALSNVVDGEIRGTVVAGPIAMGKNKESMIENLLKNLSLSPKIYSKLAIGLSNIKIFSPREVAYIASLFHNSILSALTPNEEYRRINDKFKEQSKVGLQIQKYKEQNKQFNYPQGLEDELVQKVKNGDGPGARDILQHFIDEIVLMESGNLAYIKIQVIGICVILSHLTLKEDTTYQIPSQEIENIDMLNRADSLQELTERASKIIDLISKKTSDNLYLGSSVIINQAARYLNDNYMNKMPLKTVAEELHINQSYLSTLFKREMGVSFTEYLNDLRMRRSQELLSSTGHSIVEIALLTGFDSQSYFSKKFKKKYRITPSEHRKSNQSLFL